MVKCKPDELIDVFDKMSGKTKAQDQFDGIVDKIVGNRTRTKKTSAKVIRKDIDQLVKTVSSAADCQATSTSKSKLKSHIREIAVGEAVENIAQEKF